MPKVTALRQYVVRSLLSALGSATPSAPSATVVDDVEDPSLFVVNTAPTLGTNSTSTTFWGGASVKLGVANPGLSGSKSSGSSTTVSAFTDMNGDGYPDYITDNQVEYSNARGSRDGEKLTFLNETTKNDSWSLGISGGFSRSESPNSGGQKMVDIAKQTAYLSENPSPSLSVGASYVDNNDHATSAYIDINGDGLPDRLFQDAGGNYKVCLNLGYKFMDEAVDYGLKNIQSGTSHGFSFNVGVGVDAGVVSGGKGRNTSTTTATTLFALRDMNGDGLADQLRVGKDSKCYIRYNKGNGFDDTELQASGIDFINETESKGSSDNVNFRVTIPIWLIKITAGGSTSIGTSTDYISKEIQDIDGDGFPDLLSLNKPNFLDALLNHETNSVNARLSRIACTNKLKGVTNPLGGSFTMDYRRSASTTDHPGGKWIMSSVQVNDGVDDDGKALRDSFEYAGGKYDRYDREFLGFAKVKVLNINTDKDNRTAYRSTEQRFDTDNYYTKGLLLGTTVFEGDGSTGVKRTQTDNEYYAFGVSRYIQDGPNKGKFGMAPGLDLGFNRRVKRQFIVYSPMRYTSSRLYESAGSMPTGAAYFSYNTVAGTGGEPTAYKFDDAGGLDHDGNGGFKYRAETEYVDVYSLPRKHTVYDKGGHIMRQVYAVWDPLFSDHLLKVKNVIAPGDTAVTDIGYYDSKGGGGICRIILPKNGNAANNTSTRMSYTYTYDPLFHQYLTEVKDTLGYSSTLGDYNYKYGTACKHTDINGNVMTTKLDNLGRVVSITGPNELAAGRSYTLQFEYHPELKDASGNAQKPYAITRHYDPANSSGSTINNIETVTFVDGVGRAIQVKKSGVIGTTPVMIVSGRAKYDAFGRVKAAYYPIAETDNSLKYVFNATFDSTASQIPSARTAYDVLDRVLLTKLPDGTSTQMSYAIDNGLLKTTVLDALGNKQESYANGSGKTVKTIQYNKGVKDSLLTTLFHYDAIDRTDTVTDTKGKKTVTTYDWLDRRTRLVHPASGTTNFGYDASGNQAWVQPANLISTGKKIQYFYTYNRLDSVVYPNHPENNVKYVYGGYDNTQNLNLKGHLKSIEDGSGKQEFKYGKMGEVTEVKRTLVIPNQAVATYTTSTVYDSWNRLLSMTYPDGEVVNYTYNTAGLLTGVASSANTYVSNIKYDKFEQRTYMKYGNGAETYYAYNDSNRTLTGLSVKSTLLSGQPTLMSNAYTYDRVKNVVSVINSGTAVAAANTLSGSIGGTMEHTYKYDNLYRLVEAHGDYNKANTDKNAHYDLFMGYDAMHNVISKRQEINQKGVQFAGGLNAGCNFKYTINSNNCQQISNIADSSYRYASGEQKKVDAKVRQYSYDANGNLISINIGTQTTDGKLMASKSRKMLWDEENRLLAISDNGYVSNYWYDASGERTVKMSGDGEGVLVNGILSGARTGTTNFTAYISPYLVVGNGGNYTKHIYMGSQRITSKVSNSGIFTTSPVTTGLKSKYDMLTAKIKERYDSLGVTYKGTPQSGGLVSSSPTTTANSYFYHSDHLGSSSLITDPTGAIVQHIEYVPFGEIFVNERNSSWQTPYLFNAKERDDETGLTYYGARYYDSEGVNWWSTDPQKFDAPNFGSYVYCFDSPVVYVDPNGKYGVNIHYVMTYNSLLMLGSSKQNADLIAHYSGTYADHPSQSVLDNFNPQSYNQYRNGIDYSKTANSQNEDQSVRHSMMSNAEANHMSESGALSRGLSYGWDNVFQAGNENGFSSLGVGLHALHDAFAHKGAKTSDHLGKNLSSAGMLYVDQFGNAASNSVGGDAQVITRSAIISYGLLKGDNSYIQNAYKKGLTGLLFEGMSKEQFEIISKKANAAGFYFKQFENTNHYSLKKIGE
ncbi:MAG TPA: toxin TcdB middle/N-terminal domain-containing protein [Paludibacter sp.]|nr:toxin TcdB middle/N-terminal domain-containing protein [Paludibacter sp.]